MDRLTDADYERLVDIACGEERRFLARRLADAAFAAGYDAQARRTIELLRDLFAAPGRHITQWDGKWTDEVAAAALENIIESIGEPRKDGDVEAD